MTRPARQESAGFKLACASEELSIIGHELAAAIAALDQELGGLDNAEQGNGLRTVATILESTSEHLRGLALSITEIVYAVCEDDISASDDPRAERCAATLGRVARAVEPIFEIARELAGRLLTSYQLVRALNRPFISSDLRALDLPIQDLLAEHDSIATGAGVALSPGLLKDQPLWMEWWTRSAGLSRPLYFEFDANRPNYYDYRQAVWFAEPARDLSPHLAPPHFDKGGTNDYMITATVPTMDKDLLIGLGCAEMTLSRLAMLVLPALRALDEPATLITPDGLIVATTIAGFLPAQPIPEDLAGLSRRNLLAAFTEVSAGITVARSAALPWWLLVDWRT